MSKPANQIKGILGFPVAPFKDNDQLDVQALAANITFLIDGGLDAIYVSAGAGEFQSLTRSEYEAIVEIAVSLSRGKVPVYTASGETSKRPSNWRASHKPKGLTDI